MATPEQLEDAQRKVAAAMGACLAFSWVPLVGGLLSGVAQASTVKLLLRTLGRDDDEESVETLMWFFQKKTLYIGLASYAPAIGPAVSVVLTYALGQLVIRCATDAEVDLRDESLLRARWDEIQEEIFSGDAVIASYEQFSGQPFPEKARPRLRQAIDWMSKLYRSAERLPGVAKSQDALGDALHRGAKGVSKAVKRLRRKR